MDCLSGVESQVIFLQRLASKLRAAASDVIIRYYNGSLGFVSAFIEVSFASALPYQYKAKAKRKHDPSQSDFVHCHRRWLSSAERDIANIALDEDIFPSEEAERSWASDSFSAIFEDNSGKNDIKFRIWRHQRYVYLHRPSKRPLYA
jgi:hypothetical protein